MNYLSAQLIAENLPHDTARSLYSLRKEFTEEPTLEGYASITGLFRAAVYLNKPSRVHTLMSNPIMKNLGREDIVWGFHHAVAHGYVEILSTILTCSSLDLSAEVSPILAAASQETVHLLLEDGRFDPSTENHAALRTAIRNGYTDIVESLLADPRVDPTAIVGYNALQDASERGHTAIVRMLLVDPRVDPSVDDNVALRVACARGFTELVEVLLADTRVDPSARNNYAIRWASVNGHVAIVKRLLMDPRVDPSVENNYAVRWANTSKLTEIVDLLMEDPRVSLPQYMA